MNLLIILKRIIVNTGQSVSWLTVCLVVLICADVFQRYAMHQTYNWVIELEWQFFGLIFILGSPYALSEDKHVRVDIFYARFTEKQRSWTDFLGSLLLLLPWCVLGIITGFNYASNSFYIRESSPNPGGLPFWYLIKFSIVVGFVLLCLQAIIIIYEKWKKISS